MLRPTIYNALQKLLCAQQDVVIFVPSFTMQTKVEGLIASYQQLALGIRITQPRAWVEERWSVWGSKAYLAMPASLRMYAIRCLLTGKIPYEHTQDFELGANNGLVSVLAKLFERACAQVVACDEKNPAYTPAQQEIITLARAYQAYIHAQGYIEQTEMLEYLSVSFKHHHVQLPHIFMVGFDTHTRFEQELMALLSPCTQIESFTTDEFFDDVSVCEELAQVSQHIFSNDEQSIASRGALDLLFPTGPLARPSLIAARVEQLAQTCKTVAISAPDAFYLWKDLAPRLCKQGIGVKAELSFSVLETQTGRAVFQFLRSVATLMQAAKTWPAPTQGEEGTYLAIPLDSMSWWPPEDLIDFLMSDCAHMSMSNVYRLDRLMRSNRLLTPSDVLNLLQNPHMVSQNVVSATHELLKGHVAAALGKLAQPYVQAFDAHTTDDFYIDSMGNTCTIFQREPHPFEQSLAYSVLMHLNARVKELKEFYVSSATDSCVEDFLPNFIEDVHLIARSMTCRVYPYVRPSAKKVSSNHPHSDDKASCDSSCTNDKASCGGLSTSEPLCCAYIAQPSALALHLPASFDAVVLSGQTSQMSPLPRALDPLQQLLVAFDIEKPVTPLARARHDFRALLRLAQHHVVLERALFDESSHKTYPSVMYTELLACYGLSSSEDDDVFAHFSHMSMSETGIAHMIYSGARPQVLAQDNPLCAGQVSKDYIPLVCVSPMGRKAELADKPLLSASQIEAYLRCPYLWFNERRLGLTTPDAGFSPMEAGTFVHRVLELVHTKLLDDAQSKSMHSETLYTIGARANAQAPVRVSKTADEHAHTLLDKFFDEHLHHQYLKQSQKRYKQLQIFVPHCLEDEGLLNQIRKDLHSFLDYESGLFEGFEPRFFELGFGKGEATVEYAGVYVNGSIDRVDVDAHGNALIIDYKHKSTYKFLPSYALFTSEHPYTDGTYELAEHIQTLIYARVLQKLYPNLHVVGALYVSTKRNHALSGAVDENFIDRVCGCNRVSRQLRQSIAVPANFYSEYSTLTGFQGVLDATEHMIAQKITGMIGGNIAPDITSPEHIQTCPYCKIAYQNGRIHHEN